MFIDRFAASSYVCAHRGARSLAPENTLLAGMRGVESGADFWELDVHLVADGSLVVFHDDVLTRTTNVAEVPEFADRAPYPVSGFTRAELDRLDAGGWFAGKDPFGTVASGVVQGEQLAQCTPQRIPTLQQALQLTIDHNFPMNLEIKDQTQVLGRTPGDLTIVHKVLETIAAMGCDDLILISSFNHDYLAEIHRLHPALPTGALVEDDHSRTTPAELVAYLQEIGCVGYHPNYEITTPDVVTPLSQAGIRVSPYTVNDMDMALKLLDMGCFSIITDFPQDLRPLVDAR